jgi:phage tail-like protein
MAAGAVTRPFTTFNFSVEIDVDGVGPRICEAEFSEVDGLEMSLEPKTLREGGRNYGPVHMAGPVSYGQLTLKRGMSGTFDLWKWFDLVGRSGYGGLRATAEIVVKSSDRASVQMSFVLTGCLPVKLRAPALNAKDGQIAIEEMQVVYEILTLRQAGGQ